MPTYSVSLREELNHVIVNRAAKKELSVADYFRWLAEEDVKKGAEDKG